MNEDILIHLFNRFGFFYGLIDRDLDIHFNNDSLCRFLSHSPSVVRINLQEFFYELYGHEDDVNDVLAGEKKEFTIRYINRKTTHEIYFNLYIVNYPDEDHPAIAVVRDMTNDMLSYHSLQQSRNEIQLLQQILIAKNADLDRINRELETKVTLRTRQYQESSDLANRLFTQTVNSLSYALEKRDPYTSGHSRRVAMLAHAIALEIGLDANTVEGIKVAGLLHDIGKIYVPSDFLTKPGVLQEEEFAVIKTHPRVGFEILKDIEFPWPVASYVLQHHERMDGDGYPYGLKGDEILPGSRILSVSDVVEAIATNRPYRISPGVEVALLEIRNHKGTKYDPQIAEACIYLFNSGKILW
jgi:putative nucleotidyltransferase with HDIG domain